MEHQLVPAVEAPYQFLMWCLGFCRIITHLTNFQHPTKNSSRSPSNGTIVLV